METVQMKKNYIMQILLSQKRQSRSKFLHYLRNNPDSLLQ